MIKRLFEQKAANRTRIVLLLAFILLLIGNIFSFIATDKVNQQSEWVNHTNLLIHRLDDILSYTTRAESSYRGYLIDINEMHKVTFEKSIYRADSTINVIRKMGKLSPAQQSNISLLNSTINEIFRALQESMNSFDISGTLTDSIKINTVSISGKMSNLETQIYQMQYEEKRLWTRRSQTIEYYTNIIKLLSITTIFIAILLTLYALLVFNKENKAKKEADLQAEEFHKELESRVDQLAEMNTELIELRSLEKFTATGRIARTIAHEVRNPLTNINLAIEQLKTEFEGTENADLFLDMIARNSTRINKLVSDLLDATKLTELKKSSVSINDILDDCLKDASDRVKLKEIEVIRDYDQKICKVSVDIDKIKIAFLNLIVNGIEAMDDRGQLKITTISDNQKCIIKISDTGCGMSAEQMGRLFEPFVSTKNMGNGLGLANAHNIILSHNGSIKGESELHVGTTFTISLDFD